MSVFSVLHAVLLRPLPFADSDRIVLVSRDVAAAPGGNASVGHFHDWWSRRSSRAQAAATQRATYNLSDGEPERVIGRAHGDARIFPRGASISPTLGRYFTEARSGGAARAWLS